MRWVRSKLKSAQAWVIGLPAMIFAIIVAVFHKRIESWVEAVFSSVWGWLTAGHSVAGWLIVIMAAVALAGLIGVASILWMAIVSHPHQYTEDEFGGIRWRWSWSENTPSEPFPFCPRCDHILLEDHDHRSVPQLGHTMVLDCENCGFNIESNGVIEGMRLRVLRNVDRKFRSGEWKSANKRNFPN